MQKVKRHCLVIFILTFCFSIFSFAQQRQFKIGFLADYNSKETIEILSKLKTEITTVVGEDANVVFTSENALFDNFDITLAKQNYEQLLTEKVDMIIALGAINYRYITQLSVIAKPTIVAGYILKEEQDNIKKENLTSVVFDCSYYDDFKMLQEMTQCKTVGVVTNSNDNTTLINQINSAANKLGLKWTQISNTDFSNSASFNYDVDAVYFTGNYVLSDNILKSLADTLVKKGIPSMVSFGKSYVKNGMLFTLHGNDNATQFIRRLALMTEGFINGENFETFNEPIELSSHICINFATMNALGIKPTYKTLYNMDFVDDSLSIAAEKTYTLTQIMQESLDKNLNLKSAEKSMEIAKKEKSIAKANYLPEVVASTSLGVLDPEKAERGLGLTPQYTGNANVSLNQIIYSNDASANAGIKSKLALAQKEYYNSESLNTAYDAVSAYFNSLIVKTNLQIVRLNLQLTEKNLDIANENYTSGQSGKADILRFESKKAEDTKTVIDVLTNLKKSYTTINVLLNNPVSTKIDVDETEFINNNSFETMYEKMYKIIDADSYQQDFADFLTEQAVNNAPELRALQYNMEATERSIQRYGIERYIPTIGLKLAYDYSYLNDGKGSTSPFNFNTGDPVNGYYSGGISVSLPLFSRGQQILEKKKARLQYDQISYNMQETQLNIEKSIKDIVSEIGAQLSNIKLSNISEKAAKESYDLTLDAYVNGAVPIVQLTDAQSYYIQSKLSKANARYQFFLAVFTLERYIGRFSFLCSDEENDAFVKDFQNYLIKKQK